MTEEQSRSLDALAFEIFQDRKVEIAPASSSGFANEVYMVRENSGEQLVLKIYSQDEYAEAESIALNLPFSKKPLLVAAGTCSDNRRYSLQSFVVGVPFSSDKVGDCEISSLVDTLKELHAITLDAGSSLYDRLKVVMDVYDDSLAELGIDCIPLLDKLQHIETTVFSFTHGDFAPGHLLLTENGLFLIDFDEARFCDRLYDLASLYWSNIMHFANLSVIEDMATRLKIDLRNYPAMSLETTIVLFGVSFWRWRKLNLTDEHLVQEAAMAIRSCHSKLIR